MQVAIALCYRDSISSRRLSCPFHSMEFMLPTQHHRPKNRRKDKQAATTQGGGASIFLPPLVLVFQPPSHTLPTLLLYTPSPIRTARQLKGSATTHWQKATVMFGRRKKDGGGGGMDKGINSEDELLKVRAGKVKRWEDEGQVTANAKRKALSTRGSPQKRNVSFKVLRVACPL